MIHPLHDAEAKLARARLHLNELDREVRIFAAAHPYDIVPDEDSEPGVIIMRAHALVPEEPVPEAIGAIVGDVLHNLRSALEYLAWQLAIKGKGPNKETHFPVCETRKQWADWGEGYVQRLRPEHAALIKRMQPFHGKHRGRTLLVLVRLNNLDKHALVASTTLTARFEPPVIQGGVRKLTIKYPGAVPMKDGAELFRIVELETLPDAEVNMQMEVPYTVVFGDGSADMRRQISRLDLVRIERYIGLTLRVFRDVF